MCVGGWVGVESWELRDLEVWEWVRLWSKIEMVALGEF